MGSEARASAGARASNGNAKENNHKNTLTSGTALKRIEGTVFHGLTCVADEGKVDSRTKQQNKNNGLIAFLREYKRLVQ